jgi:hypothetical protein
MVCIVLYTICGQNVVCTNQFAGFLVYGVFSMERFC